MISTTCEAAVKEGRDLMSRRKPIEAVRRLQLARILNNKGGNRALRVEMEHLLGICWRMTGERLGRPSGILGAPDETEARYALRSEWPQQEVGRCARKELGQMSLQASTECFARAYRLHERTPANERDFAFFLMKAGILRDQSALNLSRKRIDAAHQDAVTALGVLSSVRSSSRVKDDGEQLLPVITITRAFELYVRSKRASATPGELDAIVTELGKCYAELLGKHNIWALNAGMRWLKVAPPGRRPAIAQKLLRLAIFDNEARNPRRVLEIAALTLSVDSLV